METPFQAVCEAAALEWEIPSLAAGFSVGERTEHATVGCAVDDVFRVASITKPVTALLALGLLDPEAQTGVWPSDVRTRPLLSHTSGFDCELPGRALSPLGGDDGALRGGGAALPAVRRWTAIEQ